MCDSRARSEPRPAGRPSGEAPDGIPPKATLFCPACGHRSHVDGDWRVVETPRTTRVRCPDCRATVARRRSPPDGAAPVWGLWRANVAAWRAFWRHAIAH